MQMYSKPAQGRQTRENRNCEGCGGTYITFTAFDAARHQVLSYSRYQTHSVKSIQYSIQGVSQCMYCCRNALIIAGCVVDAEQYVLDYGCQEGLRSAICWQSAAPRRNIILTGTKPK